MLLDKFFEKRYPFDPARAKQIRLGLRLTQKQLADMLGIGSSGQISSLERGASLLPYDVPQQGTPARKYLEFIKKEGKYNPYQI